jgi:hypothetical protein
MVWWTGLYRSSDWPADEMVSRGETTVLASGVRLLVSKLGAIDTHAMPAFVAPAFALNTALDLLFPPIQTGSDCSSIGNGDGAFHVGKEFQRARGRGNLTVTLASGGERWPLLDVCAFEEYEPCGYRTRR